MELYERLVNQFKMNITQSKIAKNLLCYNIVKIFRDSQEISVSNGQGQKPMGNVHDFRALRWHCMRTSRATMINTMKGSGVLKTLLPNTTIHCFHATMQCNVKLNSMQKRCPVHSGPSGSPCQQQKSIQTIIKR